MRVYVHTYTQDVQELAGAAVELIFGDFKLGSSEPATRILSTLFKDDEGKEACIISLSGVVLDACRGSLADEDLSSFLEDEHSLSSGGASQAVAAVIKKHRSRIAEALEAVARSTSLPQVKSVGWRLDVNVGKNDTSRSVREPFFHINLTSKVASNQAEAPLQETEQVSLVISGIHSFISFVTITGAFADRLNILFVL